MRFAGLALALLGLSACHKQPGKADAGEGVRGGDVTPAYPKSAGPIDQHAQELCFLVHGLPSSRRLSCCDAKPDPTSARIEEECTRNVNGALASGAVEIDAAELGACEKDMQSRLSGCDWVGPLPPQTPAHCAAALRGKLAAGARCRSSLECAGPLRCEGAGPTEPGHCSPIGELGVACAMSVDPLAGFIGADQLETTHPSCRGWCERHRCVPFVAEGGECTGPAQCGPGRHCADRRCVAGALAAPGAACTGGGCEGDARCFQGRCLAPRREGECASDFECRGACVKTPGAAKGHCAKDCTRN